MEHIGNIEGHCKQIEGFLGSLQKITEADYNIDDTNNDGDKNKDLAGISKNAAKVCKELINHIKLLTNIQTEDMRPNTLNTAGNMLAKELVLCIKAQKNLLENPYESEGAQVAKNSMDNVHSILEHISETLKSWKEDPPVAMRAFRVLRNSTATASSQNLQSMSTPTPAAKKKPTTSMSESTEFASDAIRVITDLVLRVKEGNAAAVNIIAKEVALLLAQLIKCANAMGWDTLGQSMLHITQEIISRAKASVQNPAEKKDFHVSVRALVFHVNQFLTLVKQSEANVSQSVQTTPPLSNKETTPVPVSPSLPPASQSTPTPPVSSTPSPSLPKPNPSRTTYANKQPESKSSMSSPHREMASKILSLLQKEGKVEVKEGLLSKIAGLLESEEKQQESQVQVVMKKRHTVFLSVDSGKAEEDLAKLEETFANTIKDMADWHKKMRSPFKFWRPTTIANELEATMNFYYYQFSTFFLTILNSISFYCALNFKFYCYKVMNAEYVKFVQSLLDCNDGISGAVFNFIVQANLQVAVPGSDTDMVGAVKSIYDQASRILENVTTYYHVDNHMKSFVEECVERLRKVPACDALNQPTILAAVGRTAMVVTSNLKRSLRAQSNDIRILCIHLMSFLNSTTSTSIDQTVVLHICVAILALVESLGASIVTSNTCRHILLRPFDDESADLASNFQHQLDEKTNKALSELDLQTKSSDSIWDEPEDKNIVYTKDLKKKVKAASLNKLVLELTSEKNYDRNFLVTFLATYQSFSTPSQLLQKLVERFNIPLSAKLSPAIASQIRLRVAIVIKHWVEHQFFDFDAQILNTLCAFVKDVLLPDQNLSQVARMLLNEIEKNDIQRIQKIKATFNVPPTDLQVLNQIFFFNNL